MFALFDFVGLERKKDLVWSFLDARGIPSVQFYNIQDVRYLETRDRRYVWF